MALTSDRLEFRLGLQDKQEIEHAANLLGKKLSAFVREVMLAEARRVVAEHGANRLSAEESRHLLASFDRPFEPNDRLRRALKRAAGTDTGW